MPTPLGIQRSQRLKQPLDLIGGLVPGETA